MATQLERARAFRALHEAPGHFVFPNPWDGASARILEAMGYKALATSSGACAATFGRRDGHVTRDEALAHAEVMVKAVDIPIAADLEKGFGDDPKTVAETIRAAADVGLVGCSIEDKTGRGDPALFPFDDAVARVAAAVEAAKALPFPFTLTARAENFVRGNPDLDDTITRLKAFEAAGADVLFAPGLPDLDTVRTVCSALSKPFNFMEGIPNRSFPVADLAAAGVKRISLSTSLYRAAMFGFVEAMREVEEHGTVTYVEKTLFDLGKYLQG